MTSTAPPPDPRAERAAAEDPHRSTENPGDLRRWLRRIVLGPVPGPHLSGGPLPPPPAGSRRDAAGAIGLGDALEGALRIDR